jgi:GTPase SAR1 family protein
MKKANAALIVFDMTDRKSFNSVSYWFEYIKQTAIE